MSKLKDYLDKLRKKQSEMETKMDLDTFNEIVANLSYSNSALLWFQLNLNNIVTSQELAQIHGTKGKPISHNMRRIFELRDEKGYNIINHKDSKLQVDQWVLLDEFPDEEKIRERGVNKRIRFEVFERDSYTCQFCGLSADDEDPFRKGHKIKLHVGHIKAHKRKSDELLPNKKLTVDDFITMCNVCNEGAKNNDIKIITLLDKVKTATKIEKEEIYNYLKKEIN